MDTSNLKKLLKPYDNEIKQLANEINKYNTNHSIDQIVAIIYLIILLNLEEVDDNLDNKTLLINVLTNKDNHLLNRLYKIKNMPETIIVKPPIMTVQDYFTMVWDQLDQIHNTDTEASKHKYTLSWS